MNKLAFIAVNDPTAREWLEKVPEFDKTVLSYPTTRMLCSYNSHPVAFLPIHKAVVLETLALGPEMNEAQRKEGVRDLLKAVTLAASSDGIKEIYFLGTDNRVIELATMPGIGFEELPWKILRMRL